MELGGLIVGLGNPGQEYAGTRHNFGFLVVEKLLEVFERKGFVRTLSGRNEPFQLWRCSLPGQADFLVCTPLAYMNRSGEAVQRVSSYYHVDAGGILVLHDELDLPLGRMKFKKGGGNAGHNGLRSIQQLLGTPDFYRLRLGIGKPPGHNAASYVLSRFRADEADALALCLKAAAEGVLLYMSEGPLSAQRFCNSFHLPETESDAAG